MSKWSAFVISLIPAGLAGYLAFLLATIGLPAVDEVGTMFWGPLGAGFLACVMCILAPFGILIFAPAPPKAVAAKPDKAAESDLDEDDFSTSDSDMINDDETQDSAYEDDDDDFSSSDFNTFDDDDAGSSKFESVDADDQFSDDDLAAFDSGEFDFEDDDDPKKKKK